MEYSITRIDKTISSTLGQLDIDNKLFYTLEDTDRGLTSDMTLEAIKAIKVPKQTAVPTGRYETIIRWSPKFDKMVPLLLLVPGFDYIEIHTGNYVKNTWGCPLLGKTHSKTPIKDCWEVYSSVIAFNEFLPILKKWLAKERCWLTIQ